MKFNFCIACCHKITCYEDGKIFCKYKGPIRPPVFCENFRDREIYGITECIGETA